MSIYSTLVRHNCPVVAYSEIQDIWNYSPPNYLSRAAIKYRTCYYRNKTNEPYLSGDTFKHQADLQISRLPLSEVQRRNLSQARVIFCKSEFLQVFLQEYKSEVMAKVILSGNSDFEFHNSELNLPKSVKACFLQNSFISDGKRIFTLPIGLENIRLGTNGIPRLFDLDIDWESKVNRLLIGPFGLTHDDRKNLRELATEEMASVDFGVKRLAPKSLAKVNSSYRKIAAVRGNGVDTHRLWEILYLGSIPVVKSDSWSLSLKELNLPLEYVDDWSKTEIDKVAQGDYVQPKKPSELGSLWWPYWKARIEAFC